MKFKKSLRRWRKASLIRKWLRVCDNEKKWNRLTKTFVVFDKISYAELRKTIAHRIEGGE